MKMKQWIGCILAVAAMMGTATVGAVAEWVCDGDVCVWVEDEAPAPAADIPDPEPVEVTTVTEIYVETQPAAPAAKPVQMGLGNLNQNENEEPAPATWTGTKPLNITVPQSGSKLTAASLNIGSAPENLTLDATLDSIVLKNKAGDVVATIYGEKNTRSVMTLDFNASNNNPSDESLIPMRPLAFKGTRVVLSQDFKDSLNGDSAQLTFTFGDKVHTVLFTPQNSEA